MNGPASYTTDQAQLRPPRELNQVPVPVEFYHRTQMIVDAVMMPYALYPGNHPYRRYDENLAKCVTEKALAFLKEADMACALVAKNGSK